MTTPGSKTRDPRGVQFEIAGDRVLARVKEHSSRFIKLTVVAPAATAKRERPAARIAFVLDRSGSMGGDKIKHARMAILKGIGMLTSRDEFAVIAFDDQIDTVVPLTGAREGRRIAESAVERIEARNNTNLFDGYLSGAKEIGGEAKGDTVRRIILVSDGQANAGVTSPSELGRHASELRLRGVSTATLGIGDGFDERLMSAMAMNGGGPARFTGEADGIAKAIADCVGEALTVTLQAAEVVVRVPGAVFELLSGGEATASQGEIRVALGDMAESQEREVVLRVRLPLGSLGGQVDLAAELHGRAAGGEQVLEHQAFTWTFADKAANDVQPRNREVDHVVAQLYAGRAREHAIDLNRRGEFDRAHDEMLRIANRIALYAGSDRTLLKLVVDLQREAEEWGTEQVERFRKNSHHMMMNMRTSRQVDGSARRRVR